MTTLIWLAASSLLWGAILYCAVFALQSRCELSGNARQWMWRGAAMLLVLPWIAAPFVNVLAPGLTLAVVSNVEANLLPDEATTDVVPIGMQLAPAGIEPVMQGRAGVVLPWIEILFGALLAGWLVRFGLARIAAGRMRRLLESSAPARDGAGREALETWSRRLVLRRKPELRITAADVSPFSSGALRPVICLPDGIERKMRREALSLVVGHECIHVARGDGWWRPVERAVADVLWFNPFAWAIRRELDLARELACDEAVVAASDARRAYARTLRDVAGLVAGMPASAPAASMSLSGSSRLLAMRMRRTLASGRGSGRAAIVGAVLLAFAAAPVAVAQALLIEAAQPQEAPPAAPAPPSIGAPARAPQPPAPPKAPEHVQVSPDGAVRIGFPARVVETAGSAAQGYRLALLQTSKNSAGETCSAEVSGLSRLHVSKDQALDRGAVIGERGNTAAFSIAVTCSDETARARPRSAEAPPPPAPPPAPTAAPAAPSPVSAVARVPAASSVTAASPAPHIAPLPPRLQAVPSVGVVPPPPSPGARPAPSAAPTPQRPAPAEAQADRKTELVALDGTRVDRMQLRYDFDGAWVIDNQNLLYRDTSRDHYLVTLKEACKQLDIRRRSFHVFPSWSWRLLASNTYEVRHDTGLGSGQATGQPCDVARIARIDDATANTLRDAARWRAW